MEVVDPGTTAAPQAPVGATARHVMLPGVMLRVGMGALVALRGLAVTDTLQVAETVCESVTEPDPDTLPELGENDCAKDGEAMATVAKAAAAKESVLIMIVLPSAGRGRPCEIWTVQIFGRLLTAPSTLMSQEKIVIFQHDRPGMAQNPDRSSGRVKQSLAHRRALAPSEALGQTHGDQPWIQGENVGGQSRVIGVGEGVDNRRVVQDILDIGLKGEAAPFILDRD